MFFIIFLLFIKASGLGVTKVTGEKDVKKEDMDEAVASNK